MLCCNIATYFSNFALEIEGEEIPTANKIYRKAICLSWIIIYKIKPAETVILGIIHGHRRPSRIKSLRKVK
jgi:hypothetical protein